MVRHVPPTFTGEDLSLAIIGRIGKPPHPNARGALVMRLVQSELIARTGESRPMHATTSHARATPVYRWLDVPQHATTTTPKEQ
jgi:hypothetical protein